MRFGKIRAPGPTSLYGTKVAGALSVLSMLSTPVARANVVGTDQQNFNPTTSGLDFVTVQSSETLEPGIVNFGFFLNHAVNSLPYFDDTEQGRLKYTDSLLGADLNIGIGLLPGLDIGLSAPQVVTQDVEADDGHRGQFASNGNTEIRFNTKLRLYGDREGGFALVGSANVNRIKNNPYIGKDAGPTTNLELALDTTINRINLGVNFGHRWRNPGPTVDANSPIEPLGNQWIGSAAASFLFASIDTKLIFEVFGSRPAKSESENSDRLASTAEALAGIKYDFTTHLAGHIGAGTELIHGRGSPDWRIYAGLNYAIGPTFSKPKPQRVVEKGKPQPAGDPFGGPPKPVEKIVIHDILFEFDSDSLVIGEADETLKKLVNYINVRPSYSRLIIEGHTDSIGSDKYNHDLSKRRAQTIRKWLIQKFKCDPSKVVAVGKGETFPIADNGNYQGRQLNRRVEFMIYRDSMKK